MKASLLFLLGILITAGFGAAFVGCVAEGGVDGGGVYYESAPDPWFIGGPWVYGNGWYHGGGWRGGGGWGGRHR